MRGFLPGQETDAVAVLVWQRAKGGRDPVASLPKPDERLQGVWEPFHSAAAADWAGAGFGSVVRRVSSPAGAAARPSVCAAATVAASANRQAAKPAGNIMTTARTYASCRRPEVKCGSRAT